MKKKKLYDVTDVEFEELHRYRPDSRARTLSPVEIKPSLKNFIKFTGRVLYYGVVGIGLVIKFGRVGKSVRGSSRNKR